MKDVLSQRLFGVFTFYDNKFLYGVKIRVDALEIGGGERFLCCKWLPSSLALSKQEGISNIYNESPLAIPNLHPVPTP